MRTLIATIFSDRNAALTAVPALRTLETHGAQIETMQIITKDTDGALIEERADDDFPPPSGTLAGLAVGGITGGLLWGAMGAAVGIGVGTALGLARDWHASECRRAFEAEVGSTLNPGQYAILLEAKHDPAAALEVPLQQLGGIAFRTTKRATIRAYRRHWAKERKAGIETRVTVRTQALEERLRGVKAEAEASATRLREP